MKLPDWPSRLIAFVSSRERAPFAWGANDCARFAFDAACAQTGAEVLAEVQWKSAKEAQRVLQKFDGVVGLATKAFGPPMPPQMAQRGDVVVVSLEGVPTLAVCVGAKAVGPGEHGIVRVPMDQATHAWSVDGERQCPN